MIHAGLGATFDALLARSCLSCGERLSGAGRALPFCEGCAATVERWPAGDFAACGDPAAAPAEAIRALFAYGGAAVDCVLRLKYGRSGALARAMGRLMAANDARGLLPPGTIVVPVPLDPSRFVERGYNQAALLAVAYARALGLVCRSRTLERPVRRNARERLDREARQRRVKDAFRVRHPEAVRGREVRLVDDVVTTGATARECARVLLAAGATSVRVVCFARVARSA